MTHVPLEGGDGVWGIRKSTPSAVESSKRFKGKDQNMTKNKTKKKITRKTTRNKNK
jgi:hypothetical protein